MAINIWLGRHNIKKFASWRDWRPLCYGLLIISNIFSSRAWYTNPIGLFIRREWVRIPMDVDGKAICRGFYNRLHRSTFRLLMKKTQIIHMSRRYIIWMGKVHTKEKRKRGDKPHTIIQPPSLVIWTGWRKSRHDISWLNDIFIWYILHSAFCKCLVHATLSLIVERMSKFTFQRFVDDVDHTGKFCTNWTMIRKS